jgi:photosystem II stability/assembly factor-like uncharacterized protein
MKPSAVLLGLGCAVTASLLNSPEPSARATSAAVAPAPERPALLVAEPARAVLLGIARAGRRLVAVGERGIIALSDDDGATWRQVSVPTSVTLTAVAFADSRNGWATGHAGIVLITADGGEHWQRRFDGVAAAALAQRDANSAPAARGSAALRTLARQLVEDGADAPFLALHCFDTRRVLIAGANGLVFETRDGGATWISLMSRMDNSDGRHYYAIAARGNDIAIAGEQGLLERSQDGGRTYARVRTPDGGTFFGVVFPRPHAVFVAGLRGNAWWSGDEGKHFTHVASAVPVSISSMTVRHSGAIALTTQAGSILSFTPGSARIALVPEPPQLPLSAAVEAADGSLVAVGAGGAFRTTQGQRPGSP